MTNFVLSMWCSFVLVFVGVGVAILTASEGMYFVTAFGVLMVIAGIVFCGKEIRDKTRRPMGKHASVSLERIGGDQ